MKTNQFFSLAAIFAIALTFSCSSDKDDDGTKPSSNSGGGSSSPSGGSIEYGSVMDDNGKTYRTVQIGNQVWMAENLNYDVPDDDTDVCYDYDPKCDNGRLYNWVTAMALPSNCNALDCASQISEKHRGICPSEWHIPNDADWNALMKVANPSCSSSDGCETAGAKLKATSGWNNYSNWDYDGKCTDDYGFSALPGGFRSSMGEFREAGNMGLWWSASEQFGTFAYHLRMSYSSGSVRWFGETKSNLLSIRCVKD